MPEMGHVCRIKIQKENKEPECIKGFFCERGWVDSSTGLKIEENWGLTIIEWKYEPSSSSQCNIL